MALYNRLHDLFIYLLKFSDSTLMVNIKSLKHIAKTWLITGRRLSIHKISLMHDALTINSEDGN